MDATKIRLSSEEAALITRSDWILTKNNILIKVKKLLESLQTAQKELYLPFFLQDPIFNPQQPKISRGENYQGLPYLVLDYPRCFNKEDVLAIRTMFWWGKFFSVTLHLGGKYKSAFSDKLITKFFSLQSLGFYCCVNADPWEYHFESDNYVSLQNLDLHRFGSIINENTFTKISAKIPLDKWDQADSMLMEYYRQLLLVISQ